MNSRNISKEKSERLMGHKKEEMSLNAYATSSLNDIVETSINRKYKE